MMHTTCLNSSVSLRCTPSRSLYFDDRFETNPLLISSPFGYPSCCCCCCATRCHSVYNTLPRTNTSFLCNGLRQSTLIQFSPNKRLIVSGSWRQLCDSSSSRFSSGSESDRIRKYCYKKVYGFDERRKLGNSRYGRYARWSYDDKKNEECFSDESEDDYSDDVELLLDLLTEEVGLDNIGVRERKRFQKKDSSRTKTVKSGSVKRDLKCDIKENRKLSNERRTSVTVVNDHERKKQGSSCSSYYSVSSTGEYDSDNDVNEHDEYFVKGESSGECKDDRKTDSHSVTYDEELEENVKRHQEFGKKESEILKKNAAESYFGNQEWRKKSEKKLNVESSQSQHTDRISSDRITGQYQSGMKNKNSSIQKRYSDTENKEETADFTRQNEYKNQSNVILEASEAHNFDKRKASSSSSFETRMKNREETADFTRQNEYKKQSNVILEAFEGHNFDTRTASSSSSFESRMKNREETADFTRQNEYKKQSNVILGASEDYNFDKRKASFSSSFETRMKKREEDATELSARFVDQREEKYQRVDQLISSKESRVKSQQHSEKTDRITNQSQSRLQSVQELTSHKGENADFTRQNEYKKQSNVVLEASKIHNFDNRIASSSSSSFETRMKNREESSTQVSNRFEDQREEMYQRVDQTTSSKDSRLELQQFSEISDTRLTNIENTSVPHTPSDIRTRKQETHIESSSSSGKRENIEDKYSSSQVATVVGPTESMKTGRKTTKASSFNVGMPRETPSSYKALKLNPETSFQETGAHIASADEQQKSAGQIVGEFVEKAKHQLSITEGESAYEDSEQHELKSSGENGSGNFDEKDGEMGPSDEMWHEIGPGPTSDEPVERSGRSLWNVIGDVVRLRWGPSRSETHTPKSGVVSNQSTTSERWFSGHEPDESSRKDVSTPSSSKDKQDSPLPLLSSPSKSMSPIRMRRSPVVKTTSVTGETEPFTSGKSDQIAPKPLTQVPQTDASGSGKMVTTEPPIPSRRKLSRTDQVSKDRFDEWEEAYTIEAKQRKNDEFFMREALTEAKKAADLWEVPVGAVLVQDGKIIARGYNLVEELRDSTAHAEMVCIREASNKLHSWRLSGTTLYVTLEPCPMCAGAILQARIDTVVWGAPNKLLGADGSWIRLFPDGDGGNGSDKPPAPVHPFHPNMIVRRGVLSSECADAMQQFFQLRRKKKDKKPEAEPPSPPPPPPSSCLPVVHHHHHHHSKLVTKLHDAFSIMFCL